MSSGIQIPDALLAVAERGLNALLSLDPEGARALDDLEGRIIAIEIEGFGTRITAIPGVGRLQLFGAYGGEPDCLIRGTALGLLRMGLAERKEAQLISGEVVISGDTSVAQGFSRALAGLDVDWEEQLARVLGDPFAHQIGTRLRALGDWGEQSTRSLTDDLREYLQEEGRLLPSAYEIEAFLAQVDTLRDDTERLAARVARLETRDTGHGDPP